MTQLTVLFVDDDVMTQWVMSEVLEDVGYRVESVCRGADAMRLMDEASEFDLLLIDFDLPDMSGGEVVAKWRQQRPGCPVIYATQTAPAALGGALSSADGFVPKPLDARDLLEAIHRALGDAVMVPPSEAPRGGAQLRH